MIRSKVDRIRAELGWTTHDGASQHVSDLDAKAKAA